MSNQGTARAPVAVVGVDEKEAAEHAVLAAYRLAEPLKLSIELVHASSVPLDYFAHVDPLGVERARTAAAERWMRVLPDAGLTAAELAKNLQILPGRAAHVLVERARETGASFLFLGRHQRRAPLDFGDVVREVVVHAPCPVWVQSGPPRPIQRILCAIDIAPSGLEVLSLARDVARALGAELFALHCFVRPQLGFLLGYPVAFPPSVVDTARDTAEREFRRLLEPFDWRGVLHRQHFYEADPGTELASIHEGYDLTVVGTHGRTGLSKALLGSVASELLRRAKTPVLVVRTKAEA